MKVLVTVGRRLFWGGSNLEQLRQHSQAPFQTVPTRADETAAILFTSGSTGVPKGAVYSHGIFAAQVDFLRDVYGIEPGEIDLATFPLFALFGPALGMTVLVPEMDASRPAKADPALLAQMIDDFGATTMFGSPALVNNLGRYALDNGLVFPSFRRVICAGAPCPPRVLEQFSGLLSGDAEVLTPYGATESLPVCSIGSRELLADTRAQTEAGEGICVGKPVRGMTVRIIGISEAPIHEWSDDLLVGEGQVGEIVVGGRVVTSEYYNRPQSTELAKIRDPSSGEILHRMGDLGRLDGTGRLWFCGRKAHRVQGENETWFTIPCEAVFNVHPDVFRSALVGVDGEPVLCVELEPQASWSTQLEGELRSLAEAHDHTRAIVRFLSHPDFPMDARHNAKIFREGLSRWARGKLK